MARRCDLSGRCPSRTQVSHSNIKTKHRFLPNLQRSVSGLKLGKFVSLKVSASTIRTIDKVGLDAYAKKKKGFLMGKVITVRQ